MTCSHTTTRFLRGFTLVELLVVTAVIALLIALVLPAIAGARGSGQSAVCLANLRSIGVMTLTYADENRGYGPALGQPYGSLPNWALVVQSAAGIDGQTPADLYRVRSALVCPRADLLYGPGMQRTYGMNATGLAGLPGDRANFDDATDGAYVNIAAVLRPSAALMALDTKPAPPAPGSPPPTRTASVLDFRQPGHTASRIALIHRTGRQAESNQGFANTVRYDGSATTVIAVIRPDGTLARPVEWLDRLP